MKNAVITPQYSVHALDRAGERVSITVDEISQLFKWELYVPLGKEPKSNREHLLFYGVPDSQCFVAVRDEVTNTVVTILPIDYHENIGWNVSIDAQVQAKNLVVPKTDIVEEEPVKGPHLSSNSFHVYAQLVDDYGEYVAIKKVGKYEANAFKGDAYVMIDSQEFKDDVKSKITEMDLVDNVSSLIIRNKSSNKGDSIQVPLPA